MQQIIQQNQTAAPLIFLMVQSVDHISPLTGAAPAVLLSKNGAAFAAPAGAISEIGNGWYKVAANATDANTLGPLLLHATATGGDPTDAVFEVGPVPASDASGNALATAANLATDTAAIEAAVNAIPAAVVADIQAAGQLIFQLVSPMLDNAGFTIVRGDDYFNTDGRAIPFTASAGVWPVLTGATIALKADISPSCPNQGTPIVNIAGVVQTAGSGITQTVYVEIPSATTTGLAIGASAYSYAVIATLSDGHVATLVEGMITVKSAP